MKYQNYQIYLSHYWELLGEVSLEENYSRAEIAMDSDARSADIDIAKATDSVLFPGQVVNGHQNQAIFGH